MGAQRTSTTLGSHAGSDRLFRAYQPCLEGTSFILQGATQNLQYGSIADTFRLGVRLGVLPQPHEAVETDQWSHNSVTSTFKIRFEDGGPACVNNGRLLSDVCGFGWRFGISSTQQDSGSRRERGAIVHTYTFLLEISFDPHLLSRTSLGPLTLSVKQRRLESNPSPVSRTYSLPASSVVVITSFATPDIADHPFIDCTVVFPSSLHLSLPKTTSRALKQIVHQSLLGVEFIDTIFYLFSLRGPSGRVRNPQPVFASSALLKGHAPYLDTRQSFVDPSFVGKADDVSALSFIRE